MSAAQLAMQQLSQYDRVGHGHLVLKQQPSPQQTAQTALVLAQPPPQAPLQSALVPLGAPQPPPVALAQVAPPPPPVQQQQPAPPPMIPQTTQQTTTTTTTTTANPTASTVSTVTPVPIARPDTILIHIPLIPTPFRIAVAPGLRGETVTTRINGLLANPAIQERIVNALSVPRVDGWILVERVNSEYLQLRDLLSAVKEGRLMGEGVIPWVCAGDLVEGGVGYWCLGVCT